MEKHYYMVTSLQDDPGDYSDFLRTMLVEGYGKHNTVLRDEDLVVTKITKRTVVGKGAVAQGCRTTFNGSVTDYEEAIDKIMPKPAKFTWEQKLYAANIVLCIVGLVTCITGMVMMLINLSI